MFPKVLAALDFSQATRKILDAVREIPGIREVVLLHVIDATGPFAAGWTTDTAMKDAARILEEKKKILERDGLAVKVVTDMIGNVLTQGTVAQAILEAAQMHGASLIIVGARGINPIQELLLGSTSSSVVRQASISVLVVHAGTGTDAAAALPVPPGQPLFSRILLPTDFSPPAGSALAAVRAMTGIGTLILLHVVSRVETLLQIEVAVADAQVQLEAVWQNLATTGTPAEIQVLVGDPIETILSVAKKENVSLVAMHAHGADRLREMLLGSTTFSVVRRASVPVLVIRTPQGT